MPYQTIRDLDLKGKTVFMRVDFNVPLDGKGNVTSDTRIRAALPSIELITTEGAKLILASHLGRPKGKPDPTLTLAPVAKRLGELIGAKVEFVTDCVGPDVEAAIEKVRPGHVILLENLRFHAGEEANEPRFAQKLASLAKVYVNDAFGAAHRAHASTEGMVRHFDQKAAGLLMEKELQHLAKAVSRPEHPYVAIVGGAKISGKIDVLDNFLHLADRVLIGGAMAYTLLKAKGVDVGDSLIEEDKIDVARNVLSKGGEKLVLPEDHLAASDGDASAETQVVTDSIPSGWKGVDIGPQTIERYKKEISGAKLIVWNGPMGIFEIEPFSKGTVEIAKAVASSAATSLVGGGDSEKAVKTAGVADKITHISTGGGASLEFLAGQELPGVAALGGL